MMGSKKLKILLLYTGSTGFPLGDAYTNRILSLAKGLKSYSVDVKILVLFPGKKLGVESSKGVIYGIKYEYCSPFKIPNNQFQKKIIGITGILKAISLLFRKEKNSDAIISFTESLLQNFFIGLFSRIRKIYFIREVNEFPHAVLKRQDFNLNTFEKIKIKLLLFTANTPIYISSGISDFFRNVINVKIKSGLIVPIVVDVSRFNKKSQSIKNVITYCGNLFGEKDGVKILIESFSKIVPKYPEIFLQLIGDTNHNEFFDLKTIINKLGISERVIFTGFIDRDDIPKYLLESKILVLARPDNIQAKGGFPTKLGEYLATSNPVIVTPVGDIPLYLKDGINAFLAIPGDVIDLSKKISYVLDNYSEAVDVAKEGHKLVNKEFNPDYQAGRIVKFINHQILS